jgi:hypothetical protein
VQPWNCHGVGGTLTPVPFGIVVVHVHVVVLPNASVAVSVAPPVIGYITSALPKVI